MSSDEPTKYLKNIVAADEVIDILSTYLKMQSTAEMVFYPVFIEQITDLLIDLKTIVEQYASEYDKQTTEIRYLRARLAELES